VKRAERERGREREGERERQRERERETDGVNVCFSLFVERGEFSEDDVVCLR
jgi:hypothetical protein